MQIDLMRKIDTWVGVPSTYLCSLFTQSQRSLWGEKIEFKKQDSILVTKFMGLGSTVLASPFLSALEEEKHSLTIVTFKESEEFLRLQGMQCEILTLRKSGLHFFYDAIKLILQLRKRKFKLSIDLEPSANFTALLHFAIGARYRMGFLAGKLKRERLFTHLISYSSEKHLIDNYDSFAKRLEIAVKSKKHRSQKRKEKILININASELSLHRLWDEKKWMTLTENLLKAYPKHSLYFTGIKDEAKRIKKMTTLLRQKTGVKERVECLIDLDLKSLAVKVSEAEMVVSVDSFMLHFSEWCGTPVVGLYGPESPLFTGPKLSGSESCYVGLACSPCLSVLSQKRTLCNDNQCMKQLTVATVFKNCIKVMERENAKSKAA